MKRRILIPLLLLAAATVGVGQVPYFQNYTLLKKNESVQINEIYQNRRGIIWLGTSKGLFRFDGIAWKRYTTADSLSDDNVTAIQQDSVGRLWVGQKNGKLSFLQNRVVHPFDPPEGSAAGEISDILFDSKGNMWFSTLNDGLYYFTQDRLFRLDEEDGLPDLFIYDLAMDADGNVWVGTDGGIAICTLKDKKVSVRLLNNQNGLPDNIIRKIVPAQDHTMWLATEDAGVFNYDPVTQKYSPLIKTGWHYGPVADLAVNGNQLWISCSQAGLIVFDKESQQIKIYNANAGPGFTSVNVLLADKEGNIWTGSKLGLMRTLGDQLEYIESLEPAKDVNVVALTVDHQGRIWFSNSEGLFMRSVDEAGKAFTERKLKGTPYEKYTVISLYTDEQGTIWAGLYGEGVVRIDPQTGHMTFLNKELRNGNILSITGKGNVVWLATLGGGTRIQQDGAKQTIKNFGSGDGLSTDYVYQVFVDSQDRVWFATDGKGVDMLDGTGFHHYQQGLNSKVVYGFAEDGAHKIWINVQGEGLYQLEGNGFKPFGQRPMFRDNNINAFSADRFGNLVLMHESGIDIVDTKTGAVRFLGEELGVGEKKANLNAIAHDSHGHIFIGTDNGIIKYSDAPHEGITAPVPYVSGFKIFDRISDVPLSQPLHLNHDENDVTINYLGLWFQNPENLSFRYWLENYDRDWINSIDHSVTYSSLPPGEYIFHLKVSENGEFKDAKEAVLKFTIAPPFWRTGWFYFLCALLLFFAGYSFIRYRERRLIEDNRILEDKVHERTLEIQRKTEEIQAQNEEIQAQTEEIKGINENLEGLVKERTHELEKKNKSLEEYAFINAHELRAPVASILGLVNLMRTIKLSPEEQVYLEHLQKSADKLESVCSAITRAIEKGDA